MEEVGLQGAKAFDTSRLHGAVRVLLRPRRADRKRRPRGTDAEVARAALPGPGGPLGDRTGGGPQRVAAAARAIADMQLGRIDDATTANVGLIRGGVAGNIVPPECRVWAEARSRDPDRLREQVQSMLDAATYAANLSDCELESRIVSEYEGYRFARTHDAVRLVSRGARRLRLPGHLHRVRRRRRRERLQRGAASPASTCATAWPRSTPPPSTSPSPISTGCCGSRWA